MRESNRGGATCEGNPVFGKGKTSEMPSVVRFVAMTNWD
jgi:hypothetical protein